MVSTVLTVALIDVDDHELRLKSGRRFPAERSETGGVQATITNGTKRHLAVHRFRVYDEEKLINEYRLERWIYFAPGDSITVRTP